jgi:hypothetical protein
MVILGELYTEDRYNAFSIPVCVVLYGSDGEGGGGSMTVLTVDGWVACLMR